MLYIVENKKLNSEFPPCEGAVKMTIWIGDWRCTYRTTEPPTDFYKEGKNHSHQKIGRNDYEYFREIECPYWFIDVSSLEQLMTILRGVEDRRNLCHKIKYPKEHDYPVISLSKNL